MLKKILGCVAILLIVLAIVIQLQPDDFRVERSTTISAPPAAVFEQVNDLHKWEAWSPWAKLDPTMNKAYYGPASGPGSSFAWTGNSQVGVGRSTITDSVVNEKVVFRLDFQEPFTATNTAEFNFKSAGDKTLVTWSMFGKSNFFSKAIGLFMDCDKMVGTQFESGLATLKGVVETSTTH